MSEKINHQKNKKVLVLDNIRSVLNVGSIFRTSDAIGVDKIYLCGYTPSPVDRFGRVRSDISKSALGAEKTVEWESFEDTISAVNKLKEEGFIVCSLEQSENSVDYKKFSETDFANKNVAIVLGNETDGVDKNILEKSDHVMEIPMVGEKESLNVSVSAGVLLYRLFDR